MLDEFIILPFLFAIVAVIVAVKAMNEIGELRRRLDRMEAAAALARSVPPPLPQMFEQGTAPASPGVVAEPPPIAPEAEWVPPGKRQAAETNAETLAGATDGPPAGQRRARPPRARSPQPRPRARGRRPRRARRARGPAPPCPGSGRRSGSGRRPRSSSRHRCTGGTSGRS